MERVRTRVRPEHEGLIRTIRRIAQEEDALNAPRTGTVTGGSGGRVRVRMDDDDDEFDLPRSVGHRYPVGARVRVERLRTGGRARGSYEDVVTGIISEGTGPAQKVVSGGDIDDRTLGYGHLEQTIEDRIKAAVGSEAFETFKTKVAEDIRAVKDGLPDFGKFLVSTDLDDIKEDITKLKRQVARGTKEKPTS